MKKWLTPLLPVVGLLLIAVSLSVVRSGPVRDDSRRGELALRQIGHDYLNAVGDTRGLVPAVNHREDGSLLLPLELDVNYDTLVAVTARVVTRNEITVGYNLWLEDCLTATTFLGAFFPHGRRSSDNPACSGRDQTPRCANVYFALEQQPADAKWPLLAGGFGLLLLAFAGWRAVRGEVAPPVASLTENANAISVTAPNTGSVRRLSPSCSFDPDNQLLTVAGQNGTLTYREAKLLTFLTDRPNQVLDRQTIHDGVWGDEGILVGRSLDVFISRLRKKLKAAEGVEIRTVHGVGYRMNYNG